MRLISIILKGNFKKFFLFFIFFSLLLLVDNLSSQENNVFSEKNYSTCNPPVFNHDQHNNSADINECSVCHHKYNNYGLQIEDESSEDLQCSECHKNKSKLNLRMSFHKLCSDCHKYNKKGPIFCKDCHKKL